MKRYAVFVLRFALAPIISGTFVVSSNGRESPVGWAHVIAGFVTIYLIFILLVRSGMKRESLPPAITALGLALAEAIPGMPRLHAAIAPLLFAALAWAAMASPARTHGAARPGASIWILPALVVVAIFYGDSYRHQTSTVVSHIGAAMLAAGGLLVLCAVVVNRDEMNTPVLRGLANLTIAAVVLQVAAGVTVLVIRMLDLDGGLALAIARTVHITGAGPLLAASVAMALHYRDEIPRDEIPRDVSLRIH